MSARAYPMARTWARDEPGLPEEQGGEDRCRHKVPGGDDHARDDEAGDEDGTDDAGPQEAGGDEARRDRVEDDTVGGEGVASGR